MTRIRKRIAKPQAIGLSPGQKKIMLIQKQDKIKLSLAPGRPGLTHNITYLRRTRTQPIQKGPIY